MVGSTNTRPFIVWVSGCLNLSVDVYQSCSLCTMTSCGCLPPRHCVHMSQESLSCHCSCVSGPQGSSDSNPVSRLHNQPTVLETSAVCQNWAQCCFWNDPQKVIKAMKLNPTVLGRTNDPCTLYLLSPWLLLKLLCSHTSPVSRWHLATALGYGEWMIVLSDAGLSFQRSHCPTKSLHWV
jgi:hypothetical protein